MAWAKVLSVPRCNRRLIKDLPLRVRDQQVAYMIHGDDCSGTPPAHDHATVRMPQDAGISANLIPRDTNVSDQLDAMIAYLETNTLKLLKVVPANFVVLNLIAGYAATMLISVMTYVAAYYSVAK